VRFFVFFVPFFGVFVFFFVCAVAGGLRRFCGGILGVFVCAFSALLGGLPPFFLFFDAPPAADTFFCFFPLWRRSV